MTIIWPPSSLWCVSVEPPERPPAAEIRASDAEREEVVQRLAEHAVTGRLTLDELEQRTSSAYAATTRGELAKLAADLPATVAQPERRRKPTRWVLSLMGGAEKRGRWRVGRQLTSITLMGGNDLDLRHAEIDADEVTIVAVAVMGGTDIYVPDSVDVEVGGFALMGGRGERGSSRAPRPGAPRIKILAFALMGGIDVWRLPEEARGVSLRQARKLAKEAS
jgi:Domain of unknown function (DUF1707)/Cell wall-active antibiotics response 4TMS YvqF